VKANIYYDLSESDYKSVVNSRNFSGKVVLVTGSSSGIGEGIVKLLSTLGAKVVVTGRKGAEVNRVAKEAQELSPNKLKPLEVVADVTKSDDLNRLLNQTIETFGKLDVLVNNAGISTISPIIDPNFMRAFDQIYAVNLRAYLELVHLSVPYLEKTNGTIIQISSDLSMHPMAGAVSYVSSKAAVDMATRVLALELGPNIRVNTINPGYILTNLTSDLGPEAEKALADSISKATPLKRLGTVLDIAKGVAFLASSDASFMTGANLLIDGGWLYNPVADIPKPPFY